MLPQDQRAAMTDEKQHEQPDNSALEVSTPLSKATLSRETFALLLPYVGPHLKWLVYALALTLLFWGLGNGIAKVWTANTQQPQSTN